MSASEIAMTAGLFAHRCRCRPLAPDAPAEHHSTPSGTTSSTAPFFYTAKYSYLAFAGVATMVERPVNTIEKTAEGLSTVVVAVGSTVADVAEMEAAVLLLATVGQAFTPEQREAFATEGSRRCRRLQGCEDDHRGGHGGSKAAYDAFVPFADAIKTGNYNQVAALAGQGFGAGLTAVGDFVVSDVIFQKFLVGLGQVPEHYPQRAQRRFRAFHAPPPKR